MSGFPGVGITNGALEGSNAGAACGGKNGDLNACTATVANEIRYACWENTADTGNV